MLELCDMGTLQELLMKGGFKRPTGQYDLAGLVATASDVARAMHHLHTENIIHGDLKVSTHHALCLVCITSLSQQGLEPSTNTGAARLLLHQLHMCVPTPALLCLLLCVMLSAGAQCAAEVR